MKAGEEETRCLDAVYRIKLINRANVMNRSQALIIKVPNLWQ
jgi:hypothetical protein